MALGLIYEFVFLCIVMAERCIIEGKFSRICLTLGRLSVPIFCLNLPVLVMTQYIFRDFMLAIKLVISFATTLLLSRVLLSVFEKLKARMRSCMIA